MHIIDSIGYFSPTLFLLLTIVSFTTFKSKNLLTIYLVGFVVNTLCRNFFKHIVFHNYNTKRGHNMPSGHFQSMSYSFTFYMLNSKNNTFFYPFLFLYFFIALCTFYNCIHYQYHSYLEIIIGIIFGSLIGYAFFHLFHL
jgi:multisubunit Na+/H+ antiporter MnhE subunit